MAGVKPAGANVAGIDSADIDRLYGLEPVFEAGSDPHLVSMSNFIEVRCPHCFERFQTDVDVAYGNQRYIEDCQICCSPIELVIEVAQAAVKRVQALKPDGNL